MFLAMRKKVAKVTMAPGMSDKRRAETNEPKNAQQQGTPCAKLPPRQHKKQKIDNEQGRTIPKPKAKLPQKSLHISHVDRWNTSESDSSSREETRPWWESQGKMLDPNGRVHDVPKVKKAFMKFSWRNFEDRSGREDAGQPLSPKTVPEVRQMNGVEYERCEWWEDEQLEADGGRLDPDTLSPFYPGLLTMYGKRQVP